MVVRCNSLEVGELLRSWLSFAALIDYAPGMPDYTMSLVTAETPAIRNARPFHFVYSEHHRIGRTTESARLVRVLETHFLKLLGEHVNRYFLLHSAALAHKNTGILFPGQSGSGKSSLALGMLQSGLDYLSDELSPVDIQSGEVIPYSKPISLKSTSVFPELFSQNAIGWGPAISDSESVWYVHPNSVRPESSPHNVPVRYIFFPVNRGNGNPNLHLLEKEEAARKLLECSANFHMFGGEGLRIVRKLADEAECYDLSSGELTKTVKLISSVLG